MPAARLEYARLLHLALRAGAADPALVRKLHEDVSARGLHAYSNSVLDYLIEHLQKRGTLGNPPEGKRRARA